MSPGKFQTVSNASNERTFIRAALSPKETVLGRDIPGPFHHRSSSESPAAIRATLKPIESAAFPRLLNAFFSTVYTIRVISALRVLLLRENRLLTQLTERHARFGCDPRPFR